jgi:hypothetical protein
MKLVVCVACEGEFTIRHSMDDHFYQLSYCPFCSESLDKELEDDVEEMDWDDE